MQVSRCSRPFWKVRLKRFALPFAEMAASIQDVLGPQRGQRVVEVPSEQVGEGAVSHYACYRSRVGCLAALERARNLAPVGLFSSGRTRRRRSGGASNRGEDIVRSRSARRAVGGPALGKVCLLTAAVGNTVDYPRRGCESCVRDVTFIAVVLGRRSSDPGRIAGACRRGPESYRPSGHGTRSARRGRRPLPIHHPLDRNVARVARGHYFGRELRSSRSSQPWKRYRLVQWWERVP